LLKIKIVKFRKPTLSAQNRKGMENGDGDNSKKLLYSNCLPVECTYMLYSCIGYVRIRLTFSGPLRGGQTGKLPRAPRQRRGPVIPQNEFFLSPLGMKAEADNSNVNFSQMCDDVSSTIEQLFCHCHCAAHALYLLYL